MPFSSQWTARWCRRWCRGDIKAQRTSTMAEVCRAASKAVRLRRRRLNRPPGEQHRNCPTTLDSLFSRAAKRLIHRRFNVGGTNVVKCHHQHKGHDRLDTRGGDVRGVPAETFFPSFWELAPRCVLRDASYLPFCLFSSAPPLPGGKSAFPPSKVGTVAAITRVL